jgi:hypothetical protein
MTRGDKHGREPGKLTIDEVVKLLSLVPQLLVKTAYAVAVFLVALVAILYQLR